VIPYVAAVSDRELMTRGCPALWHLFLRKYITDVFVLTKVPEQTDGQGNISRFARNETLKKTVFQGAWHYAHLGG
jgi:hypothetical protein